MRKIMCFIIAMIMAVMPFTAVYADNGLNPRWAEYEEWGRPSAIVFDALPGDRLYVARLYKDGEHLCDDIVTWGEDEGGNFDFTSEILKNGSGSYRVRIGVAPGDEDDYEDDDEKIAAVRDWSAMSTAFDYTEPEINVPVPTSVSFDGADFELTYEQGDIACSYGKDYFVLYPDGSTRYFWYHTSFDRLEDGKLSFHVDEREMSGFYRYAEQEHARDSENRNIADAKLGVRVHLQAYDIREAAPVTVILDADGSLMEAPEADNSKPAKPEEITPEAPANRVVMDKSVIKEGNREAVKVMYHLGVMPNIYRDYDKLITKGDLAEILTILCGGKAEAEKMMSKPSLYSDVKAGSKLNGYAHYAAKYLDMNGMSDGKFYPDDEITMGLAEYMLERILTKGMRGQERLEAMRSPVTFQDFAVRLEGLWLTQNLWEQTGFGAEPNFEKGEDSFLTLMGYSEADLEKIKAQTEDEIVYADEFIPKTTIQLTIGDVAASLNGDVVANDVAPKIVNGRTMLPIRFIAEALNATVDWNGETKEVTIKRGALSVKLTIGEGAAYINGGGAVELDSPSFIENGRTYLPVRFVAESLGARVEWNGETQTVTVLK